MLWFLGDFLKFKLPDDALKESRPRGARKFIVGAQGLRPARFAPSKVCPQQDLPPARFAPSKICPQQGLPPARFAPSKVCPQQDLPPAKFAPLSLVK